MSNKLLLGLALSVLLLATLGFVMPVHAQPNATVYFFSQGTGYLCFTDYQNDTTPGGPLNTTLFHNGPICLSDNPSNHMPSNVTLPEDNYTVMYLANDDAAISVTWYSTNNVQLTPGAYDNMNGTVFVQMFPANVTVNGNGAIIALPS